MTSPLHGTSSRPIPGDAASPPRGEVMLPVLHVCGINQERAAIAVREKFALNPERVRTTLEALRNDFGLREALVLSTCNRTEIYVLADEGFEEELRCFFLGLAQGGIDPIHLPPVYTYEGLEAARHIFAVCAGLDSMILGENEIKAQIRQAFDASKELGLAGPRLHRLVEATLRGAKRIKTETDLNAGTLSVGKASILRAEGVLGTLEGKVCVVIGAGKVGRVAAEAIAERKPSRLLIVNRTPERAREVAEGLNAEVIPILQIGPALREADLILGAAFAPNFLVTRAMFQAVRSGGAAAKPVCLIDTAVPRILDQAIGDLPGVTLLDISHMESIIAENRSRRLTAAQHAWAVVEEEVEKFRQRQQREAISPLVERLKGRFDAEFGEAMESIGEGLDAEGRERLRLGLHRLRQKLFHTAVQELKSLHVERPEDGRGGEPGPKAG